LQWEKRLQDGKRKYSIADEAEFLQKDLAAEWIKRAESRQQQLANKTKSALPRRFEPKAKPRAGAPKRFADLRPDDPRDQLAGVDMSKMPWD
jgi:hypothetical protein